MEYSALKPDEPLWYNRGMPAKDMIHDAVRHALEKDGWTITDDPLSFEYKDVQVFIDLGAERVLAAQRNGEKIAVEIKSFIGRSVIQDFEDALGQFNVYQSVLRRMDPERQLFVAVSIVAFDNVFQREGIRTIVEDYRMSLLVIDIVNQEVIQWIPK